MHYYHLASFQICQITGNEAGKFLQGLITCNINDLPPLQAQPAAFCNLQGRVITNFFIWQHNEQYCLWLPESMIEIVVKHLKKYALFSKIKIEITNKNIYALSAINHTVKNYETSADNYYVAMPNYLNQQLLICGNACDVEKLLIQAKPLDLAQWHLAMIEAGWSIIYPETSGLFTPQMLNLEKLDAVSFEKGCYLGQEIVARTQHLGKVKKHLHKIELHSETMLLPGMSIQYGENNLTGVIINAVHIEDNRYCALAVLG